MIAAAVLIEVMDLALVATRIPALMMEIRYARAQIKTMMAEGRDPTPAEIEAVMSRLRTARDRLHR